MMKYLKLFASLFSAIFSTFCSAQNKTDLQPGNANVEIKEVITSYVPNRITRNIIQDRKGNIWIASWDGIFRYNGISFTNITKAVSSARFHSVLEDRKGNLWFSSVGSGVYYYDGKSFQNFTTLNTGLVDFTSKQGQGLGSNSMSCIYEDRSGNIWFGSSGGGASRYDGKSFQHFTTNDGLPENSVTSITEDKTGKLWFATGNNACVYDGEKFTVIKNKDGKSFKTVSIIEDKKGNIWFGGGNGLWRYDGGSTFTNFTQNPVSYIIEDKKGNIWTSSISDKGQGMALSRYEENSSFNEKTLILETNSSPLMNFAIFGIFEDYDGNIWFGAGNGVYRYDGNTITSFKNKESQK